MTDALSLEDIPIGEARTTVADGQQVAVFRLRDGSLRALSAVCPHLGGPLADGISDNRVVICPLHARSYDLITGAESAGGPSVRAWSASVDTRGEVCITATGTPLR